MESLNREALTERVAATGEEAAVQETAADAEDAAAAAEPSNELKNTYINYATQATTYHKYEDDGDDKSSRS